jgi:hypothetical protein
MSMLNISLATNTLCEVIPNMQTTYWTHFAVAITSEIMLYSNGSIMATKNNASIAFLPKQLILGAGWSSSNLTFNNYFAGRMDEVRIWRLPVLVSTSMRTRTAEDVSIDVLIRIRKYGANPFRTPHWLRTGTSTTVRDKTRRM